MLDLDSSALAKLYLAEPESKAVSELVKHHEAGLFTSRLTCTELISVLSRSHREGRISARVYAGKKSDFLSDWTVLQVVELTEQVLERAADLIERHRPRGADAVHLRSALWLDLPDFAGFDARLSAGAEAEGLRIVPPVLTRRQPGAKAKEMELLIREAQPDDAEEVVAIFNSIIEAGIYTVFDTPFTVEDETQYIENLPNGGFFLVAVRTSDQRIVGFQSLEPFASYTRAFDHVGVLGTYVSPDHRRPGIARSLFQASFKMARQKGYEKIFTFVRADNPAALATYQNQGFSVVGTARKHAKLAGSYIDEVLIEKFL